MTTEQAGRVLGPPSGEREPCQHRWRIEPANGHVSGGVCKLCGYRREFVNSFDDYVSDDAAIPSAR